MHPHSHLSLDRNAPGALFQSTPSYYQHMASEGPTALQRLTRARGQLQRERGADPRNDARGAA